MKKLLLLPVLIGAARPGPPIELLTIVPPPLAANEYIDSFRIDTQGVDIIAACHIPFGWTISLGIDDSVTGSLKGQAGLGPTFITRANRSFDQLRDVFLIRIHSYAEERRGQLSSTFTGHFVVGRYGNAGYERQVELRAANLNHRPVQRCPAPRP